MERNASLRVTVLLFDNIIVAASLFAAYLIRMSLDPAIFGEFETRTSEYVGLALIALPTWTFHIMVLKLHSIRRWRSVMSEVKGLVQVTGMGLVVLAVFIFLLRLEYLSRLFIVFFAILSLIGLWVNRTVVRMYMRHLHKKGFHNWRVLIVGSEDKVRFFTRELMEHSELAISVSGFLSLEKEELPEEVDGLPVLGTIDDLSEVLDNHVIDEVFFLTPKRMLLDVEESIHQCLEIGVQASVEMNIVNDEKKSHALSTQIGIPLMTFTALSKRRGQLVLKQISDPVVAALLLLVISPVFVVIGLSVLVGSGRPIFFKQQRVGLRGRNFSMYKFRTMVPNAEKLCDDLRDQNEATGPVFKIKNDSRITPIGRILRRSSLDELPQLINVVKGEMSLVGPRPPLASEVAQYKRWQQRRLSMKPGITGLWQVSGRSTVDFDQWMELDMKYIDSWSFFLDMQILLKTIGAVAKGDGAY